MSLNHKLHNIQQILDDSKRLLEVVTNGGDTSAYAIIKNLDDAFLNLSDNWKGRDASKQINNLVTVYNGMVGFRQKMSELAIAAYEVGILYSKIQSANGAPVDIPTSLEDDIHPNLKDHYDDGFASTVDINPQVLDGKSSIDRAKNSFGDLENNFRGLMTSIFNNWTAGDGRSELEEYFQNFSSKFGEYQQLLDDISKEITTSIGNYGG